MAEPVSRHALQPPFLHRAGLAWAAHLPEEAALSVSIGITELAEGDAMEWMLSRADLALYEAKSRGRDRTEVRPADPAPPARRAENSFAGK